MIIQKYQKNTLIGFISLLFVIVMLFGMSLTSATQFDNVKKSNSWKSGNFQLGNKDLEYNPLWEKYKPIQIDNIFGLGKKLFSGALTEHTKVCDGDYCYSIMEIYTSGDDPVVDDIIFKTKQKDNSWIEQNVRRWKLSYFGDVNDYEYQCVDTGETSINGTKIQECSNVKIGSHKDWVKLNLKEKLLSGNYKIKLEAWKKPSRTVDWIIKTNGEWLNEWAVWESGEGYREDANSTYCSIGTGLCDNSFDGDYSTNTGTGSGTFYTIEIFNFSQEVTSATWYYKLGDGYNDRIWISCINHSSGNYYNFANNTNGGGASGINESVIIPSDCLNNSVVIKMYMWKPDAQNVQYYEGRLVAYAGNVELTSPSNDYTSDTNNVQFNATATVTGGATLTNMSLWTNETGSWEVRNTTILLGSINVSTGFTTYIDGGTVIGKTGVAINVSTSDIILNSIEKIPSTTATNCFVGTTVGGNEVGSSTFIGNLCTFGSPLTLSASTSYFLTVDKGAVSYTLRYNDTVGAFIQPPNGEFEWYGRIAQIPVVYGQGVASIQKINADLLVKITSTQTWNRTITDNIIWNVQACDSDGDCGFATSNYTLNIDKTAPTINILYPNGTINTMVNGGNTTLNYSISDTSLDSCWYEYNGANNTITNCSENTTFTYSSGVNNITVYANDSVGNLGSGTSSWELKILENSQNFTDSVVEGAIENFSANVTISSEIEISSAILVYNGTNLSSSISSSGQIRILKISNYQIPDFIENTNVSFYWSLLLTDSTRINLSTKIQTVGFIGLDNCSTYSNILLNLNLFDEELKTNLNGTIEVFYKILNIPNYDNLQTISGKFENVSNLSICSNLNLTGKNLAYSTEIKYTSDGYTTEKYNIQKIKITTPPTINLYPLNLSDTTEFKVIYQDSSMISVENAIIQLYRRYIPDNDYLVVEAPLTGDGGVSVLHIDLNSNLYKVIITKDGEVLDVFDNLVFVCDNPLSGQCTQKLLGSIDPNNEVPMTTVNDFSYSVTFLNDTITTIFNIPSGEPATVNIQLVQTDEFGNSTLCNKTVISSGGSIECTFDKTIGDSYLLFTITKNGFPQAIKSYVVPKSNSIDFLGNNFFIVFIFLISIIGMAFTSPEWIIMNSVITMLVAGALFLLNGLDFVIGLSGLVWLILGAGILIFKLTGQEDK